MRDMWVGTRKGLVHFSKSESGWAFQGLHHPGIPVPYAFVDPRSGMVFASLDHGHWGAKLSRSDDGGETWKELTPPTYPKGSIWWNPWAKGEDKSQPAKLDYLWVMQPGGADQPGRIWFGTNPGGLFLSDDHGETIELVQGLWDHPSRKEWMGGGRDTPGIHSVVVDPRDSGHVFVGISCAGVFETTDGGETWAPRNTGLPAGFLPTKDPEVGHDPHFVMACASTPDVLWQQNHIGIWRSADGAKTWDAIHMEDGPAKFGFPIAVHAENPQTAWVVPAISDEKRMADGRVLVCRTDDGGKTWREQTNGLPQAHAWDLVYRHALDIDGDSLAFGSTTGNLFTTDDGGESWQTVSHHLPPIYSVRFA